MLSDEIKNLSNDCPSEDLKIKKSLKSSVIADDDPLKIKLKICKKTVDESSSNEKASLEIKNFKTNKNHSSLPDKNIIENGGNNEKVNAEEKVVKNVNVGEPKMKLRSKKEFEGEMEQKKDDNDGTFQEKRKRTEFWNDKEVEKCKKRGKIPKSITDDNLETGESFRKRSKRNDDSDVKPTELAEECNEVKAESFCWTCHKDGSIVKCDTCPRVFHLKCVSLSKDPSKNWICPECSLVLHAEKISTRSEAMKSLSLDQLCTLLNFAIGRMKNVPESQAFWKPVDPKEVPFYDKYITNPMDLNLLEKNMKAKMYGSPQAFLADAKWLLHNSIIFNSTQSPLTSTARFLVKICKQEMAEIENCPDCYLNAHTKDDWFVEVCRKPHILIWARLKGFPFWPAKAMSTNLKTQQVDARFFGAHDKAWVPVKECYLYSKNSPQLISKKRVDLDDAFLEVDRYIKKIRQKFGTFSYAPDKTPFMPELYDKQLQSMIPNFKADKNLKKKRRGESLELAPPINENNKCCKVLQNGKKKIESETSPKQTSKRPVEEDISKSVGDLCLINDEYMSEEKIVNDGCLSPEDEIAQCLEMFDTHDKAVGETVDENSTDLEEDGSIHIPEHGYSRSPENVSREEITPTKKEDGSSLEVAETEQNNIEKNKQVQQNDSENSKQLNSEDCLAESSDTAKSNEKNKNEENELPKSNSDQCEVSSTSADIKTPETEYCDSNTCQTDLNLPNNAHDSKNEDIPLCSQETDKAALEKSFTEEPDKKEEDQTPKSFVNLSCDQQQKILTEAKLLAALDEMTALGKQKVLNDLGLDASQIDIQQLAQENRQILEVLHKKCLNETKSYEGVAIKNEDFEQYLIEENSEENIMDDSIKPVCAKYDSLKDGDVNVFSNNSSDFPPEKCFEEPMLKIMDVQSLRDLKHNTKNSKIKKRKCEDYGNVKKLKLKPVVELFKIDKGDKSANNLNRKLNLSDEVSLLMVNGEKAVNVNMESANQEAKLKLQDKVKPPRARKSMPNRSKTSHLDQSKVSPKNVSVISVDTENSAAQKNLLKSLKLEEKRIEDFGRKTVLITTNDSGVKNVELKNTFNVNAKKQVNEITIEAVKESGKCSESSRDSNSFSQKSVTVMTSPQVIVTNNGPAFVTNQSGQPNLALTQNNLGHLSLVQFSNVPSGIQTNLMTLTNDTIGFNNSLGTLYNPTDFNSEALSNTSQSSVIISPNLNTGLSTPISGSVNMGSKECIPKLNNEAVKFPLNKVVPNKTSSGISVKSPASLGVMAPQTNKLPPLIAISGEGIRPIGEVGSVTAELNQHSFKMAEYMRATIEEFLKELSNNGSLEAKYKLLTLEMEKLQWKHQQEIFELKQHSEKSLMELRNTMESDKQKCLGELKAQLESQHKRVISETKRKQWCANCGKEALFYCCWNTSYCDYPCQQLHWPGHMGTCAQLGNSVTIGTSSNSQHHNKNIGSKQQNCTYVPLISRGGGGGNNNVGIAGGIHAGKVFSNNRRIPSGGAQAQSSQEKRSNESFTPQLPVNVTIRTQQYFS